MPPVINPRSVGSSWGTRLAIMAGRVLPPGGVERTRLWWMRCVDSPRCGDDDCLQAGRCLGTGPFLVCSRCRDDRGVFAGLTIIGPLTAPLGVSCEQCGGRDSEVQADTGIPPGYTEAMARIAEWNATLDQRAKRRKECVTPFDWLPLWHPGAW
jgi:hypothetical protein